MHLGLNNQACDHTVGFVAWYRHLEIVNREWKCCPQAKHFFFIIYIMEPIDKNDKFKGRWVDLDVIFNYMLPFDSLNTFFS